LTNAVSLSHNADMRATITQLAAYVGKSERTIQRRLASGKWPHKRLPGGLVEIDDSLLLEPESEQEGLLLATLQRIERKLDALSARVDSLSAQPAQVTHRAHMSANLPPAQGTVPEGLTPWRDYAKERGFSESTIARAIARGEIPVHRGRWKRGQAVIKELIDDEGKAAMDRLYGG
jgi:hypothetical protein